MNSEIKYWGDTDFHNPWRNLAALQRGMDRLFDDALTTTRANVGFRPQVDIDETDSHYLLSLDIPGMARKDIHIECRDNELVVSGERKRVSENKETTHHTVERSYGRFERTFRLPVSVDTGKIEAECRDGVLMIALPKSEAAKPKRIEIREGRGSLLGRLVGKKEDDNAN